MELTNFTEIIGIYKNVITKFKSLPDVQNGNALAWKGGATKATFENTPKGLGDGLGTTGWCVSASQALLNSVAFQQTLSFRNAKAKLVSIDIKEQYWGVCYNGSQNKWHTAILVEDNKQLFIVDITCRQFGNDFIEKDFWDFNTWCDKLRSPICTHKLTDFENKPVIVNGGIIEDCDNLKNPSVYADIYNNTDLVHKLKNVNNLTDNERKFISHFMVKDYDKFNNALQNKTLSVDAVTEINKFLELMMTYPMHSMNDGYAVLGFKNKKLMIQFLDEFVDNGYFLRRFVKVSDNLNDACIVGNTKIEDLNIVTTNPNSNHYMILKFSNVMGSDFTMFDYFSLLLPPEMPYNISVSDKTIYNTAVSIDDNSINGTQPKKLTNTIVLEFGMMS